MDETIRKASHFVFGIGIAAFILTFEKQLVISVLAIVLLAGLILSELVSKGYRIPVVSAAIEMMERKDVTPGKGALFFAMGALIPLILLGPAEVAVGVLALAVLDSVATVVGLRFGRYRIYNGKSMEGAAGGIAATAIVLLLLLPPERAVLVAVIAGAVELLSPVDDNLVIPIIVAVVLTILG
ncbi:MAG: phosphatidate cytidylyltransferase [Methanoregulaceae archaeon]|nr:phosphatidate cytidylyltransferase [Methanoregulaceae archaeon]